MSATLATIVRPEVTKRANPFARIFSACCDWIARHFVRRTAIATFRGLDDRALRDIGLERSQIEAAACGFVTLSRSSEGVMMASSAAMGPRANGRRRASTAEAARWS